MPDLFDNYSSEKPNLNPSIYVVEHISDPRYDGVLKVGYTTRPVSERVAEFDAIKTPDGKNSYRVVYSESAMYPDGSTFMDHEIHKVLNRRGFTRKSGSEWFACDLNDVKAAILAVKQGTQNVESRIYRFKMRPEQEEAVRVTKKYFEAEKKENPNNNPKFLWNAKMRFGKTFAAYQLAKAMGMERVLILTL